MSFPTSRERREKPEVNVAHVRPMVIKEPVSMATQWSLPTSGHLSRIGNMAPSLTATGLSSFPLIRPRDVSPYQQAAMMNALPPFHLLPGNDVFHAGLATSYPHYAASLSREELLPRDVIPPGASVMHCPPFLLNNGLLHNVPFHPMSYPYGLVKDNNILEPYRPLVLSKPSALGKPSRLEKLPMSQINESLVVHSRSPPAKRKCHLHEKIWDHKTPSNKKEVSVCQITDLKQSHLRDSKCVLRVPEIKPQHSAFTHIGPVEESGQSSEGVLDLSIKKKKQCPYDREGKDRKDIASDKKEIGPELAMRTAPVKVTHSELTGSTLSTASWRMDSVIRMAPRLDKGRRDEGFNADNCRISHAVPINNAAQKHSLHENHLDKGNQQVLASNSSLTTSKLDYENTEKRRRRKQNKPQYHKQENESVTEGDVTASSNSSHHGDTLHFHSLKIQASNEHKQDERSSLISQTKDSDGIHKNSNTANHNAQSLIAENNEILRGDCHQVLLAQHILSQVGQPDNVGGSENVTAPSERVVQLNENATKKAHTPKKRKGPTKKKVKSFNIKEILGQSHNGFKPSVDGKKKRGRKPKDGPGPKSKSKKASLESSDKSEAVEAANCQPLKLVANEVTDQAPKANETCTTEACTPPPKRKRGRPRKSESLAKGKGGESIGMGKATTAQQKPKKGRRAGKKVQTQHKKVHTSRSKHKMPVEKNCRQTQSQGPLCLKRCSVQLCKLQMDGRQSIKLSEIPSVSQCLGDEANKLIMKSKSFPLSLEHTKAWDSKGSLDESFGFGAPAQEISNKVRQDGLGPGRRKKRSCGYPYSPLLFAIGHCPLPHCVACKGHTAAKNYVRRRRKTQTCKLPGEKQMEEEERASGDQAKVTPKGCSENGKANQFGCTAHSDGPVITASAPNITRINTMDQNDMGHPGYHPNSSDNGAHDTKCSSVTNSTSMMDTANNNYQSHLLIIPGEDLITNSVQANPCDNSAQNNSPNEYFQEDDCNNSVSSDQTELCVDEEVNVEDVESYSPLCVEAKVEGSLNSLVQLENQWGVNETLSDQQEGQTVQQEASVGQRGDYVKCDQSINHYNITGPINVSLDSDTKTNLENSALRKKNNCAVVLPQPHSKAHSPHTQHTDINSLCYSDIFDMKEDDCSVRDQNTALRGPRLVLPEDQTLKAESYDAQEREFLEDRRQIVAYKGIVTLDETENVEMYPSGVYVSSVV